MEIGGILPPRGAQASASDRSPKKSRISAADAETKAAADQREAIRKADDVRERIETTEREGAIMIDHLKDEHDREIAAETSRAEAAVDYQKNSGYEQIRNLKRQQEAELNRIRRDGEKDLSNLKDYYRNATYATEHHGKQNLEELESRQFQQTRFEQTKGQAEIDQLRKANANQIQELREGGENERAHLKEKNREEYTRIEAQTQEARERSQQQLQSKYQSQLKQYQDAVDHLETASAKKLGELRTSTSQKLAAYEERQSDPFYKLYDMEAQFKEEADHYVLTAKIPEHEQKDFTVAIKGNQLVLTGFRRNEEKAQHAPGHTQTTNSYQTYSETFPLLWPVDGRKMGKQFDGDQLTVVIPKKEVATEYKPYQSRAPKRLGIDRPDFPNNLPKVASEEIPAGKAGKDHGSGTLT